MESNWDDHSNKKQEVTPSNELQSYLPEMIPKTVDDSFEKSEEVQSIIERMPTYWTKWVVLCVGVLIKYPDTVDG